MIGAWEYIGVAAEEFFLSRDLDDYQIENDMGAIGKWRWMPVLQRGTMHLALNLIPGETAFSPELNFSHDMFLRCHLTQTLDTLSDDGLVAQVLFRSVEDASERVLFEVPMLPGHRNEIATTFELGQLEGLRGWLGIRCQPGPLGDPTSDWLGILAWVVGYEHRLGLLEARSNRSWRSENEIAAFDTVYGHAIYDLRANVEEENSLSAHAQLDQELGDVRADREFLATNPDLRVEELLDLPAAQPLNGEGVYHYGHRMLNEVIGDFTLNFAERLKQLSVPDRPLRFLTLCSGEAGVERKIVADAQVPIVVTLFDINEKLTLQAAAGLSRYARVRMIIGDVNEMATPQFAERFDVIACVSGLHHVVELEHVTHVVSELLVPNGEFWLIGEQVGRNGNRLWPEAAEEANRLFVALPAALRHNAHTGQIDPSIPDIDFAANTFEGIRSSEIEKVLQEYFEPLHVVRRNCFLWRVFEMTYFANYDLSNEEHRSVVLAFVAAEYNFWKNGGRPSELYGVYRRKTKHSGLRDRLRPAASKAGPQAPAARAG